MLEAGQPTYAVRTALTWTSSSEHDSWVAGASKLGEMYAAVVAQLFGISQAEAVKIIERFGGDREKIYAAAETLKQGRQA